MSLLSSTIALQRDIQQCIDGLVTARIRQDKLNECVHRHRMESLMCATLQQLQCITNHLTENETANSQENHAE